MGYDPTAIVREVREILLRHPGLHLSVIARQLRVDRHTVTRSVKRVAGLTFEELQVDYMRQALERLRDSRRLLIRKEVAQTLGLSSTRALLGWIRKIERRSRYVSSAPK